MKKITLFLLCAWLLTGYTIEVNAQTSVNEKIFSLLNLNYPGLEQVKALYQAQKQEEAAQALLSYYRERKNIHHPDINLENIRLSPQIKKGPMMQCSTSFMDRKVTSRPFTGKISTGNTGR